MVDTLQRGSVCRYGTEEQRQRYLPQLVSMDKLASYCLTEPNSGSDAASLATSAKRDGSSYVLSVSSRLLARAVHHPACTCGHAQRRIVFWSCCRSSFALLESCSNVIVC